MALFEDIFFKHYRKGQSNGSSAASSTLELPVRVKQIAVLNQKGGCGKTTTAVNLSATLAEMGARVLLVDVDPQAHATLGLGIRGDEVSTTLYDALKPGGVPLAQAVHPTYHPNLKIVPSNTLLASLQIDLVDQPEREYALSRQLADVRSGYHFVFLDCPPSLNLLTVNALVAATHILIPLQTHYLSLDGMRELFKTIDIVREKLNPDLEIMGILPTLFDHRTRMNRAMLQSIRDYFNGKVFETVIHLSSSLSECPMSGQPVLRYDPRSKGTRDYQMLAEEILRSNA